MSLYDIMCMLFLTTCIHAPSLPRVEGCSWSFLWLSFAFCSHLWTSMPAPLSASSLASALVTLTSNCLISSSFESISCWASAWASLVPNSGFYRKNNMIILGWCNHQGGAFVHSMTVRGKIGMPPSTILYAHSELAHELPKMEKIWNASKHGCITLV